MVGDKEFGVFNSVNLLEEKCMLFSLKGLRLSEPADHVKNVAMQRVVSTPMSLR